ncbi:MAG: SEN2-like domain-containing protein [Caldisphaera sp.]|jgi:tRNA-intron endonuclease|nr:MAG: hypothetical protein C0202_02480 [Caldisphaera sp.]
MENERYLELENKDNRLFIKECFIKDYCKQLEKYNIINDNRIDELEGIYLITIDKATINQKSGWSEAIELLRKMNLELHYYIVYYDLRKRGRRVWKGIRESTLIAEMPNQRKLEVLILKEGNEINPIKIANWSELAVADAHTPIVAIVDKNGEVTYYESRIFNNFASY